MSARGDRSRSNESNKTQGHGFHLISFTKILEFSAICVHSRKCIYLFRERILTKSRKKEGKMSEDMIETHQRNEGKWGGGSYLKNEMIA